MNDDIIRSVLREGRLLAHRSLDESYKSLGMPNRLHVVAAQYLGRGSETLADDLARPTEKVEAHQVLNRISRV